MANELTLTRQEIERISKMDNNALTQFAKEKSAWILTQVCELSNEIEGAISAANEAKEIKTGFLHWGGTRRKADLSADALTRTNKAVDALAKIQQEAIMFTCISTRFAMVMHETMAKMMAEGLRDANGNIRELDGDAQEFAQHILDAADDFTRKQAAVEAAQQKQDERIEKVASIAQDNQRRLEEKDRIEAVQNKNIADAMGLARGNRELLSKKNILDSEQSQAIAQNRESGQKQGERIAALERKIEQLESRPRLAGCLSLFLSLLALACAVCALYMAIRH